MEIAYLAMEVLKPSLLYAWAWIVNAMSKIDKKWANSGSEFHHFQVNVKVSKMENATALVYRISNE